MGLGMIMAGGIVVSLGLALMLKYIVDAIEKIVKILMVLVICFAAGAIGVGIISLII